MSIDDKIRNWKSAIDRVASLYADVERRSLTLPEFSLAPLGIWLWTSIKFSYLLVLDLFLIVPMNFVTAVRNIFPGRWAYRSFSASYFRAAFRWIRNGEIPLPASVLIRSLTGALLSWHFHTRLSALRRRIMLDDGLDPDSRTLLTADVDRLLLQWPNPKLVQGLFTFGLPLLSPVAAFYQMLVPSAPAVWTRLLVLVLLGYALGVLASAFVVKRGLMLGGEEFSAYLPGFLEGSGAYATEREVLATFGLAANEFPLAYALTLLLIPVELFQSVYIYDLGVYAWLQGETAYSKSLVMAQSMAGALVMAVLGMIALARRRKLGRC